MDATHPQHNPVLAGGWIKRGEEQEIPTNTGRRVNINGAIDLERLEPVVRFDDTINADSTIALFKQLEAIHLTAVCLYVICDNARYYRSKAVQEYLETSRIKLVFLPPYAPNLNLIERFARPRGGDELAGHRQQVIQGQQEGLTQRCHHRFLGRGVEPDGGGGGARHLPPPCVGAISQPCDG